MEGESFDCVSAIIEASGNVLNKREAGELLRRFQEAAKDQSPASRLESVQTILSNYRENMIYRNQIWDTHALKMALDAEVKKANHIATLDKLIARTNKDINPHVNSKDATNTPSNPILRAFESAQQGSPDSREGWIQTWEGARIQFQTALATPLEEAGLLDHYNDPATLKAAVDYLWDPEGTPHASPEARQIAGILDKVQQLSVRRLNDNPAHVNDTPRVLFNTKAADSALVGAVSQEEFVAFCKGLHLDEKYFQDMDEEAQDQYFGKLHESLKAGAQYQAPTGTFDGINGLVKSKFQNVAATASRDYDLPFADSKSYHAFIEKFSESPLSTIIYRRVDQIGRSVGLMSIHGGAPERMMEDLYYHYLPQMNAEEAAALAPATGGPTMYTPTTPWTKDNIPQKVVGTAKDMAKGANSVIQNMFMRANPFNLLMQMDGRAGAPVNGTVARAGATVRAATMMGSMGYTATTVVPHLAFKISHLVKYGANPFEQLMRPILATVPFMNALPKERMGFYSRLGITADAVRGNLIENTMGSQTRTPGMLSWLTEKYFWLNRLHKLDTSNRGSVADAMGQNLANELVDPKMGDETRKLFESYGYTDTEFSQLRLAVRQIGDRLVVDPEMLEGTNSVGSDTLHAKYLGTMNDIIHTFTNTPDTVVQAITHKGTRPGTYSGEALSSFMLFKSYPIMLMSRTFPILYYEHGMQGVMATMTGVLGLWWASDTAKQLMLGLTPRDMSKPENVMYGLIHSGAGALYSDYLLGEYNHPGQDAARTIGGPVVGKVMDAFDTYAAMKDVTWDEDGNMKYAFTPKKAVHSALNFAPSLPFRQILLDRMLIYGILGPEVMQKQDEALKARTGQERLF